MHKLHAISGHEKALRWHIDYLLTSQGVRVVEVVRSRRTECALNRASRGRILAIGFGAPDCRADCGAHLKCRTITEVSVRPQAAGRGDDSNCSIADTQRP